ncbi:germin-like protein 5-1 [Eucalyptus grandis]|uniref:germin-like protein 5-1 n=1 Tax=Eucalyptus grandis TaxID=71139 RepID=UPI00192ECDCD|nr:germin-like protein 5-1 [Eucalyptus grandis]
MEIGPRMVAIVVIVMSFAIFLGIVSADPDMLQDVCVADLASKVKVNGFPCKETFNEMDFFWDGLAKPEFPNNTLGSLVTRANVEKVPGLNTLGLSLARGDFAPYGLIAPHTHPRASEMVFVLYGEIYAGFITTANILVAKTIKAGEIFVFPRGLVHFQMNVKNTSAAAIAVFNSQLAGAPNVATALFAAKPTVPNDVLAKAFQIDAKEVEMIKARLAPKS